MTDLDDEYHADLAPFADLGCPPVVLSRTADDIVFLIVRDGVPSKITITTKADVVIEEREQKKESYSSFRAFLASNRLGSLASLATNQRLLYKPKPLMRVPGRLNVRPGEWEPDLAAALAKRFLSEQYAKAKNTRILLIEGPAGIGKSRLIEEEVAQRAHTYATKALPLVVHVESRGRLLAFINEVVAFTLQRLRWNVTYEQVPVLCRHGLVIIAIDGFDELGDPNGYENAWAQLRDFIESIRGGTIILAGRETFIGRDRLLRAVPMLASEEYNVGVLQLEPLRIPDAKEWLVKHRWSEERIEQFGLLEEGSYALRPFFLNELARMEQDEADDAKPPLVILVDALLAREVEKLPDIVKHTYGIERGRRYFETVGEEIARYMRDAETDSIDADVLAWLSDISATEFDDETRGMLRARVKALPFLVVDGAGESRRFAHTEFLNYFLCWALIRGLARGDAPDIPKFVRRTILGTDFLNVLCTLINHRIENDLLRKFVDGLGEVLRRGVGFDRSESNLWSVAFACLASAPAERLPRFSDIALEEVVIRGKAGPVQIRRVWISQLDIRSADISACEWDAESRVRTVMVDGSTKFGFRFPSDVEHLQLIDAGEMRSFEGEKARRWLEEKIHEEAAVLGDRGVGSGRDSPAWKLAQKVCYKMLYQYWIREGSDDPASALLREPEWSQVEAVAEACGLLQKEKKQAAGAASMFYHLRKARKILSLDVSDTEVRCFLEKIGVRSVK